MMSDTSHAIQLQGPNPALAYFGLRYPPLEVSRAALLRLTRARLAADSCLLISLCQSEVEGDDNATDDGDTVTTLGHVMWYENIGQCQSAPAAHHCACWLLH